MCLPNLCSTISGGTREGKQNRKTTALTDVALDRNCSIVSFNNVLHERQAEATAFHVMDQSVAYSIKLLEHLRLFGAWNADAAIRDFDIQIRSKRFRFDRKLLHRA